MSRIRQALDLDRLRLAYQPLAALDPARREGTHIELLPRMEDSRGHLVPSDAFLPAARRFWLLGRIDRWVVANAFDWLRRNPARAAALRLLSINVSAPSFAEEAFLDFVLHRFDVTGIAPDRICFEIPAASATRRGRSGERFVRVLREWGCSFAIDNFRSRLCSVDGLRALDVDFLKIDGHQVRRAADDPGALERIAGIHEIARVMGRQTVAECVENERTLEALRTVGVDYVQGDAIAPPRVLEDRPGR